MAGAAKFQTQTNERHEPNFEPAEVKLDCPQKLQQKGHQSHTTTIRQKALQQQNYTKFWRFSVIEICRSKSMSERWRLICITSTDEVRTVCTCISAVRPDHAQAIQTPMQSMDSYTHASINQSTRGRCLQSHSTHGHVKCLGWWSPYNSNQHIHRYSPSHFAPCEQAAAWRHHDVSTRVLVQH